MAIRIAALAAVLGLCVAALTLWPARCDVAPPGFFLVVVALLLVPVPAGAGRLKSGETWKAGPVNSPKVFYSRAARHRAQFPCFPARRRTDFKLMAPANRSTLN